MEAACLSLTECHWSLNHDSSPVRLPGMDELPLGVFVRGVPGGTLEQVIIRLDILHALEHMGVVVYNTPEAIERTVDKAMTSFLLQQAGLPGPNTWVTESIGRTQQICAQEFRRGNKLLLKPLFGSQGTGIRLLENTADLENVDEFNGLYYLQSFVRRKTSDWSDIRVFVIDGLARAAMLRKSESWLTNRAQGALCEPLKLDDRLRKLTEAAVAAVGIDYAGVDLIIDENDQLQIIEVNSIPAWWGLQKVTDLNIADALIEHFISRISTQTPMTVIP